MPNNNGPPMDWFQSVEQLVDLAVVFGLSALIFWSVWIAMAGMTVSSFRPPQPQREVLQVTWFDESWDNRPSLTRLQL